MGRPDFTITPAEGEDVMPEPGTDYTDVLATLLAGGADRRARLAARAIERRRKETNR